MEEQGQNDQELPLSRTKKKQQAKEIEKLAQQLASMSESSLRQLSLDEALAREVALARSTRGRGSHKRQVKHLAGLLRKLEDDLPALLQALGEQDQVALDERRQFHQLEQLRDRLCEQESFQAAFDQVLLLCPGIDRKAISRLARSVHQNGDRRAYRELFRRLRDELEGPQG